MNLGSTVKKIALTFFFSLLFLPFYLFGASENKITAQGSFKFVAWGDTKSSRDVLSELSDQAIQLNPAFTIYAGDLESSGFTTSGMAQWKDAMNGQLTGGSSSNGMFDRTFPVRGNHDSSNSAGWQNYFDLGQAASRVGATNYAYMSGKNDLVYSFDYGNSHMIGLDVLGSVSSLPNDQISWIDSDLAQAEARGLTHAFIYFHGPIYCVDGHCSCSTRVCSLPTEAQALVEVFNKHPIVSATFHGHEHVYTYTYLDLSRIPASGSFAGVTRPFHQLVTGDAGAGPSSAKSARYDFWMNKHGFVTVDVSGSSFTVTWYQSGSMTPYETRTYTKSGSPPTVAPTPTSVPGSPTSTPTATPTPGPATPTPGNGGNKFNVGDRVEATETLNVKSSPGTGLIGTQPPGARGTVLDGPQLGAGGNHWWWLIDFDSGSDGWSREDLLVKVSSTPTVTPQPTSTPRPPTPTPTPTQTVIPTSTPTPPEGPFIGDADGDGDVDEDDYTIWLNFYTGSPGSGNPDFNRDLRVDGIDYVIWVTTQTLPVATPTPTEPQPTSTPTPFLLPTLTATPTPIIEPSPTPAPVNCVVVDNTINLTPTGGQGTCHDLQEAVDAVGNNANYWIRLAPGVYDIPDTGGTHSVNIIGKDRLHIEGSSQDGPGAVLLRFNGNGGGIHIQDTINSTLEWVTIEGNTSNGIISLRNNDGFHLNYNRISDSSANPVDAVGLLNSTIGYNQISSNGGFTALRINDSQWLDIVYNVISNNSTGIDAYNTSGEISFNLFDNNSVNAIYLNKPTRYQIFSNTIVDSNIDEVRSGALLIQNVEPIYETIINAYKNIIVNSFTGVRIDGFSEIDSFSFRFNDVWNNQINYNGLPDQTGQNGNINQDPLFGAYYCLMPDSPALYGDVQQGEYMGVRGVCFVPTPPPTPTPTLAPDRSRLNFKFRLQGITSQRADLLAKVTLKQAGQVVYSFPAVLVWADDYGAYSGVIDDVDPGTYDLLIKTRSHLQKKFSDINIAVGENAADFSNLEILVGDVNDDNLISIEDVTRVLTFYTDFSIPVAEATAEDVNNDQRITIDDVALALLNFNDFYIPGDD